MTTPKDGVMVAPEPGLVPNPAHRASEEGTHACTCHSYPHKNWCGPWMPAAGVTRNDDEVEEQRK